MKQPKYIVIANAIESDIAKGIYIKQLPHIDQLAIKYQTSKVTICKSLQYLAIKDIVRPVRGHGCYIQSTNARIIPSIANAREHTGFSASVDNHGSLQSNIISFYTRYPTEKECEMLKIASYRLVYDIIRQRVIDDEPLILEYTIMPVDLIPDLTLDILHNSIYAYIKNILGLDLGKANRIFRADKSDAFDAKYLNCQADDPVLKVEQIAYLANGKPFEYSQTRRRYDKGEYILNQI